MQGIYDRIYRIGRYGPGYNGRSMPLGRRTLLCAGSCPAKGFHDDHDEMGQEGVPSLGAYLDDKMPEGGCLGFDGRVVNAAEGLALEELLKERGARISYGEDLAGMIWQERPELSAEPAWVLDERYAGKSALEKIADVREAMKRPMRRSMCLPPWMI